MTMISTRAKLAATLAAACLLGPGQRAQAQDRPKDEGLEKLLEKLDEPKAAPVAKDKDKDRKKDEEKADKTKAPGGDVAPEDKGLDKLLEGLGQSKDVPAPDDKKPGGPGGDPPMPPKPDQPKGGEPLDPKAQELDDILGQKAGDRPKKQPRDKKGDGQEGGGPLGDVIKQMRDVEERLGKPDTGEETRKKQVEIVKNLETLIEQMKDSPSQSQGLKMIRQGKKPGPPNGQPGSQPGATGDGTDKTRPDKPRTPPMPVEVAKEIWGQLPAQFRDDMANVLNEHPLPTKTDLIRLYYLSLGKKSSTAREE